MSRELLCSLLKILPMTSLLFITSQTRSSDFSDDSLFVFMPPCLLSLNYLSNESNVVTLHQTVYNVIAGRNKFGSKLLLLNGTSN